MHSEQARRKDLGLPGNGGRFSERSRTESGVELVTATASTPAVGWEARPWKQPAADSIPLSQRQKKAARGNYRASIPADIAEMRFDIDPEVAADAADALVEIVRFDAEIAMALPDPNGAEIAPLAAVLLRTESASSSEIENVTAGAKALALAVIDERAGANAVMVAANVAAMQEAIARSDSTDEDSILAIHLALMAGHEYASPGQFRTEQAWIGSGGPSPHTATFVPPHADRVPHSMSDLVAFIDRTDVPLLAHAALAHAQFETIHPFNDGNGRTGRTLVHAMLRKGGATTRLTIPVSAGLLVDTRSYFEALTAYRKGDPNPIVERFANASFVAVGNGRTLVGDLRGTYDGWQSRLSARSGSAAWSALPVLLKQPAVTVKTIEDELGVSQPTAWRIVEQLVKDEILVAASENRRNRVFVANEVIDALDAFAKRSGRRT